MANPQVEDGYTRIANETIDRGWKLLSSSQRSLFIPICRLTYGFNKCKTTISLMKLVDMTGLTKQQVINILNDMENRQIITIEKSICKPSVIGINKNYNDWLSGKENLTTSSKENLTSKDSLTSKENFTSVVKKTLPEVVKKTLPTPIKESTKKTLKKNIYADFVQMTAEDYQKLIDKFGEATTKEKIEDLNFYKGSKGVKYANDYLTILAWDRNDKKKREEAKRNGNGKPRTRI